MSSFELSPCYGCGSEHGTVSLCCQRIGAPPFQINIVNLTARTIELVEGEAADYATFCTLPPSLADLYWQAVAPDANGVTRLPKRLPCLGLAPTGECLFQAYKPTACSGFPALPDDPESRCSEIRAAWPGDPPPEVA